MRTIYTDKTRQKRTVRTCASGAAFNRNFIFIVRSVCVRLAEVASAVQHYALQEAWALRSDAEVLAVLLPKPYGICLPT